MTGIPIPPPPSAPPLTLERIAAMRAAIRDAGTPLSLCVPTGIDYGLYLEYRLMLASDEYQAWLKSRTVSLKTLADYGIDKEELLEWASKIDL